MRPLPNATREEKRAWLRRQLDGPELTAEKDREWQRHLATLAAYETWKRTPCEHCGHLMPRHSPFYRWCEVSGCNVASCQATPGVVYA